MRHSSKPFLSLFLFENFVLLLPLILLNTNFSIIPTIFLLQREILGDEGSEGSSGDDEDESASEDENEDASAADGSGTGSSEIVDLTGTNLIAFRRNVYLTIMSSINFEECAHKLMKMNLPPNHEVSHTCFISFYFIFIR